MIDEETFLARRSKARAQQREHNAQEWADFKAHWPMHAWRLAADLGAGTLLGVLLGLSMLLYALDRL